MSHPAWVVISVAAVVAANIFQAWALDRARFNANSDPYTPRGPK